MARRHPLGLRRAELARSCTDGAALRLPNAPATRPPLTRVARAQVSVAAASLQPPILVLANPADHVVDYRATRAFLKPARADFIDVVAPNRDAIRDTIEITRRRPLPPRAA